VILTWCPRPAPLAIQGVAAAGAAGRRLGRTLLARGTCAAFYGLVAGDLLVLLGPEPPWVDGAVFVGQDPEAPGLYLPTWLMPAVHPALVQRAVHQQLGLDGVVLLLPHRALAISLDAARPVDPAQLEAWL